MILCNMNFLAPEDSMEKKIWLDMVTYTEAVRGSQKLFNTYKSDTLSLLEDQLLNRTLDENCVNYPLLDDAETDCTWGIHYYTESDVKDIERSLKRSEIEYSGKNCTDTTTKHFDEKMVRQYVKDMQTVDVNTSRRFTDAILDCYTAYMLRRGFLSHDNIHALSMVFDRIQASELTLGHYYANDPDEHINVAFYQRTGYNNTRKNIVVVSSHNPSLADELFGHMMRNARATEVQVIVVPEEQFYSELATLRTSASRYTVVSKKFDSVMTLLSLFRFSLETKIFEQVNPKSFMETNYIGLYGVEKQEMNTLAAKDVYLLKVPGYTDNYYGVVAELLPLKCSLEEEVKTRLLVSDKVEVDKFELVDKDGTPISVLDGTITWENVDRDQEKIWGNRSMCWEKHLMDYPDVVSFGKLYHLTMKTNTDCFIRISCHVVVRTNNNPGAENCMDEKDCPIIQVIHKDGPYPVGYDGRENFDEVTPGFKVLYIPFCSNIKKLDMLKEWYFGCGELADLMQLYAVYHIDSKNPNLVTKKLLNGRIHHINIVSSTNIDGAASVGWFHKDPGKECIIPDHQDGWYLRVELKDPIWVYTCMGIQLHLEKDVIRMTSERGCSYNIEQNVDFHLVSIPMVTKHLKHANLTIHHHQFTLKVYKEHPKCFTPVIDETLPEGLKEPLRLVPTVTVTHKEGTTYRVNLRIASRDTLELLQLGIYRLGKSTDRVRQYVKKKELLNPPEWFAASSDCVVEDGTAIAYDINLDLIQDNLKDYELHFYIPSVLITKDGNTYLHRNVDFVYDLGKL